jgi:hypothetical protein
VIQEQRIQEQLQGTKLTNNDYLVARYDGITIDGRQWSRNAIRLRRLLQQWSQFGPLETLGQGGDAQRNDKLDFFQRNKKKKNSEGSPVGKMKDALARLVADGTPLNALAEDHREHGMAAHAEGTSEGFVASTLQEEGLLSLQSKQTPPLEALAKYRNPFAIGQYINHPPEGKS